MSQPLTPTIAERVMGMEEILRCLATLWVDREPDIKIAWLRSLQQTAEELEGLARAERQMYTVVTGDASAIASAAVMADGPHTPGPWSSYDRGRDGSRHARYRVGSDRLTLTVADVYCGSDASLIASAPDLLERLRDMTEQHRCACGHPACNRCEDARLNDSVIRTAMEGDSQICKRVHCSRRFHDLVQIAFLGKLIGMSKVAELLGVSVEAAMELTAGWIDEEAA